MGLYDMVMVKDNHLLASSDPAAMRAAIDCLHAARPEVRVEVEADNLAQVARFVQLAGVSYILLDNMTPAEMREAVAMGAGLPIEFEASGGINLATVRAIAETGVHRISVGALTHSARAMDYSLEFLPGDRSIS